MNIKNAYAAYGLNNTNSVSTGEGLEAALSKLAGEKGTQKSDNVKKYDAVEALYTDDTVKEESGEYSEIYTKNVNETAEGKNASCDMTSEAEKNFETVGKITNKVTPEELEKLINEGFDVFGMTPDELFAAVDRLKLSDEVFEDDVISPAAAVFEILSGTEAVVSNMADYVPQREIVLAGTEIPKEYEAPDTVETYDYKASPDTFAVSTEQVYEIAEKRNASREQTREVTEAQIEQKHETREQAVEFALKILNGNPAAKQIAEKLVKANLPVTEANVIKISRALEIAGNETKLSSSEAEYLVRNKMAATLENIAEAKASAQFARKEKILSEQAWNQLQPTVSHLLFQAGLKQNKDIMDAAKEFIKKDIPLTAENLKAYAALMKIKLSDSEILTKSVDAISVGQDPVSANLLSSSAKQVRQIIKNNESVTDEAIDYAVAKKAAETGDYREEKIELSLGELHSAQSDIENNETVPSYLEDYARSGNSQAASIKARRQLEEVKAKMTYEAGYRLAKEGIRIDAVTMNRLINDLRALENRYYSDFFKQSGTGYTQKDVDLLRDTTMRLHEIENMPCTLIYDTVDKANSITLNGLYTEGLNTELRSSMGKYTHTLETVMTMPSAKYGDSIEKAFANVDGLLKETGIDVNDATRRAARILGYAEAPITQENVSKICEYDAKLQETFDSLHPAVTVKLIKNGINPLNETINGLNEKIAKIREEDGIKGDEGFSSYIIGLDRKNELTSDEREAYLAIYRALHRIQDSKEAALGQVFKAGGEPSLQGLLTAVRSGKMTGRETIVNDTFENLSRINRDVDRIENKIRAGLSKTSNNDEEVLNNAVRDADKVIEELSEDIKYTAKEWADNLREIAANGQNATRFLEDFNILTTIENIELAKDFINNDMTVYKNWKRFKTMATGEEENLPDLTESLNSEDEMQEAYSAFLSDTKDIKNELLRDPSMSKLDVKALKKLDNAARFMNRLAKRRFYHIPVEAGGGIIGMNVTVISDSEDEKSKVFVSMPTENLGNVTCEASIENNKMKCFIKSTENSGMEKLKESQLNLFAALAQNGITIGSIYYGAEEVPSDRYEYKTDGAYKNIPEGEKTGSTSNELYRIAKAFVTHVREADER